ncbi:MAG: H-NS histone family protein [Zoogloea sp.]|jgi:DNA-binding protein H-NS|nr:MAG: H-NS histone family protein [Zoogloea sp.]
MTTLKELLAQQAQLAKQIEEVRKAEVAGAIKQVKAIIDEYELTAEDIFPQKRIASSSIGSNLKVKGVAKYQSRIDPNLTWTGRGRKPEWVITFLGNGGTLEELEIKSN